MKLCSAFLGLALGFALSLPAFAAEAPAGSTGECKDGTYTTAAKKKGACSDHGGVKDWYGKAGAKGGKDGGAKSKSSKSKEKASSTADEKGSASSARSEAPATRSEMPSAKSEMGASQGTSRASSKSMAGGGAGQVWVNKPTKVYHCQGDRWYGKTKDGAYMSESEAKAQGYRPDHGKDCASR